MTTTREVCKICLKENPIGFNVPDSIWKSVVAIPLQSSVVCVSCFTQLADDKLIAWDEQIEFFPISLHTHRFAGTTIKLSAAEVQYLARAIKNDCAQYHEDDGEFAEKLLVKLGSHP